MTAAASALFAAVAVLVAVEAARRGADLAAHWSRYRRHLSMYPATRAERGRVWKGTR